MYTKGKWKIENHVKIHIVCGKVSIATTGLLSTLTKQEKEDNAERICLCVNSHDQLLEALKEAAATFVGLVEGSIGGQAMKKVNAAIATAKRMK